MYITTDKISDNITLSSGNHQVLSVLLSQWFLNLSTSIHFHGQHHNPSPCSLSCGLLRKPEVTPRGIFMICKCAQVTPGLQTFNSIPAQLGLRTKAQCGSRRPHRANRVPPSPRWVRQPRAALTPTTGCQPCYEHP